MAMPPSLTQHQRRSLYADGRLSANDGCDDLSGTYSTYGDQIYVGPLTGGRMTCGGEINAQELSFKNALQSATTFKIEGNQLILKNSADTEVLRFNHIG